MHHNQQYKQPSVNVTKRERELICLYISINGTILVQLCLLSYDVWCEFTRHKYLRQNKMLGKLFQMGSPSTTPMWQWQDTLWTMSYVFFFLPLLWQHTGNYSSTALTLHPSTPFPLPLPVSLLARSPNNRNRPTSLKLFCTLLCRRVISLFCRWAIFLLCVVG